MATGNPLDGKLVVLLGGGGFVGRPLAQELLARGARIRIACRHPERAFFLKPLAKLGQIQFVRCDVTLPGSLGAALSGAGAVVNLAAAWGARGHAVMAEGAGNAAAAAREAGIADFVQISSIGADPEGATHFARDKAEGEARVLATLPRATILRPSVIFGEDDKFLSMFARAIAALPAMPLFAPDSLLQIVWVDDVAAAVSAVLEDRQESAGKTYELAGPERLSVIEINRRIARAQGRERLLLPLPDALSAAIAALPLAPLTLDQWKMLKAGNVASGEFPGFTALGIVPKPLELFLERWMVRYRKHGRFGAKLTA